MQTKIALKRLASAKWLLSSTPASVTAGIDCNLSGKRTRKAKVPPRSSGAHSSSPQGHQRRFSPRLINTVVMAGDAIFPPGELRRSHHGTARAAHTQVPGSPDRAPISEQRDVAWFRITDTARLGISQGDITRWSVDRETDAIVNAANQRMLGGGGVDGAIHRRAGPRLRQACEQVPRINGVRCPTGKAKLTEGFDLPASRVIHTVGPIYYEDPNPAELLRSCYLESMEVAVIAGIKYIAFPAISCGVYGYPFDEAAEVSLDAIKRAPQGLAEIHLIHFNEDTYDECMKVAEREFKPW